MRSLKWSLSLCLSRFHSLAAGERHSFRCRRLCFSKSNRVRSLQPKSLVIHSSVNRRVNRMWRSLWARSRERNRSVFFFAEERTFYKKKIKNNQIENYCCLHFVICYLSLCVRVNICIRAFCYVFRHRFRLIYAVCSKFVRSLVRFLNASFVQLISVLFEVFRLQIITTELHLNWLCVFVV